MDFGRKRVRESLFAKFEEKLEAENHRTLGGIDPPSEGFRLSPPARPRSAASTHRCAVCIAIVVRSIESLEVKARREWPTAAA
jgi:hypothetical protein